MLLGKTYGAWCIKATYEKTKCYVVSYYLNEAYAISNFQFSPFLVSCGSIAQLLECIQYRDSQLQNHGLPFLQFFILDLRAFILVVLDIAYNKS